MGLFIFVVIIIGIVGAYFSVTSKKNKIMKNGSEVFDKYIKEHNLNVTKLIKIPGYDGSGIFFIDDINKSVNYMVYKTKNPDDLFYKNFAYKDVIKCELIKDGKTALVKDVFSVIDRVNKKEYIKKLGIKITFNDLSFPFLDIYFVNSAIGVTMSGLPNQAKLTNEWLSLMNIVIEQGKKE